jgi:DNA-3-methyladenine glycosylase
MTAPEPMTAPEALHALLAGAPEVAARGLLGWLLVRDAPEGRRVGRIVETEAYGGAEDLASHARFGQTARNRAMFAAAGRAYVYGVYGMHTCLNVVTGPAGEPSAVLVRAVEPLAGIALMRDARLASAIATRRVDAADPAAAAARLARIADAALASGPANCAAAFGITRADDGGDLLAGGALRLVPGEPAAEAASGPRIGVAYAGAGWAELPWRFWLAGKPSVSGGRR